MISMSWAVSLSVLFILLMHLVNGLQFLNITSLSLSSVYLAASNCAAFLGAFGSGSGPVFPVTVIVLFTSMYASA